jgi:SAM-dependent methyltransferase
MQEPADRITDHYERHANAWDNDRRRAGWNDKPWHHRFLAVLASTASVLDLGCGSGAPVAQHLAERGLNVTGVDASPTLISLCRQRLPGHNWLVGDMRTVQLSRRFDGILARDSFFHLRPDDQRRMFNIFARHAAPSAVLMFNTGPAHHAFGSALSLRLGSAIHPSSASTSCGAPYPVSRLVHAHAA